MLEVCKMRKFIGYAVASLPFFALLIGAGTYCGWKALLIVIGIGVGAFGCVCLGLWIAGDL